MWNAELRTKKAELRTSGIWNLKCEMAVRRRTWWLAAILVLVVLPAAAQDPHANKGTLQGVVTDPTGAAVVNATATLYSTRVVLQTQSGPDGRFQFVDVPLGGYTIEVELPGLKPYVQESLQITAKRRPPLVIELFPSGTGDCSEFSLKVLYVRDDPGKVNLRGIVRDYTHRNTPLAKARLSLSREGSGQAVASRASNDKGEFQFEVATPGRYILTVSMEGYGEARTRPFWVTASTMTRIETWLLKAGMVIICE